MGSSEYYYAHKDKWAEYHAKRVREQPLYTVWQGILVSVGVRPGAKDHEVRDYINRGIGICDEWLDYKTFEEWALSHRWKRELRIDRIDNNKGYCPSNCRFVTVSQNQNNRRNTHFVIYNGKRMALADAWRLSGSKVDYKYVEGRVAKRKWDVEKALSTPINRKRVKPIERSYSNSMRRYCSSVLRKRCSI